MKRHQTISNRMGTLAAWATGAILLGAAVVPIQAGAQEGTNTLSASDANLILGGTVFSVSGTSLGITKVGNGTTTLTGANTYTGNTTIYAGTLALSGGGSVANSPTITIAPSATFDVSAVTPGGYPLNGSGTLALNINKSGATFTQGQLVLGAKNLTYGGALTVTATGDALASGDGFILITNTGTKSGWFSSVTLPTLASGISWDTNDLATAGILDVYTFTTTPLTVATSANTAATIPASKLANHSSSSKASQPYPTGWTASASGATLGGVSFSSGNMIYTAGATRAPTISR